MSVTSRLLHQAALNSAKESTRRLGIDSWSASKLAPIALSLVMLGMLRQTRTVFGAALIGFALNRHQEDLTTNPRRLSRSDVRARSRSLSRRIIGRNYDRAITALADLALIDFDPASDLLSMTAEAAASALSKARRELKIGILELHGVLKSEAAGIASTDPVLVQQVSEWVFRPSWASRTWEGIKSVFREGIRLSKKQTSAELNVSAHQGDVLRADASFRVIVGRPRRLNRTRAAAILAHPLKAAGERQTPYRTPTMRNAVVTNLHLNVPRPRLAGAR